MYILKISSKWFSIRCSFVSKSQNPKMALCGVLIGKVRLVGRTNFSWFHILLIIMQSQDRCIIALSFNLRLHDLRFFFNTVAKKTKLLVFPLYFKIISFHVFGKASIMFSQYILWISLKWNSSFTSFQGFIFPLSLNNCPIKFNFFSENQNMHRFTITLSALRFQLN